jgi:predicted HicB family RNase H-like nuclease
MSHKDLKYYKNLEYTILIERINEDNISAYIAYSNELGKFACYGKGKTQVEAINNFLIEKDEFIEYLFNARETINEPKQADSESYSGFFNVRTSSLIHANLVVQAKQMNISLNLYLNQILAGAVERKMSENLILDKIGELCGKLESHHFEVTRQLKYQVEEMRHQFTWHPEYSGRYLEIA